MYAVLLCFVVCLTLLAFFFLPSSSLINMYNFYCRVPWHEAHDCRLGSRVVYVYRQAVSYTKQCLVDVSICVYMQYIVVYIIIICNTL